MIDKIRLKLGKKLHLVLYRCEGFGVFGMKTEHYLPETAVYVGEIIVTVRRVYLIFCLL